MADKDLNALFLDTLKDIYYAEKQIYKSRPKNAQKSSHRRTAASQRETDHRVFRNVRLIR
jgi:ferritin-like metal-binding protein YciE